jgi:uncharacterized protein YyaL (SSP411 family)
MNELHLESSPYLLQHSTNPIFWKAWNHKTLELAKKNNKLIIISIGYSACHWCHVMEHESFEDNDVAQVMNDFFISIKIDREERPDIDATYMKAVQVMTNHGGWPMNVVALPDGRPIWGGTYFRKEEWINALQKLQNLYSNNPETIYEYAEKLHNGLKAISLVPTIDLKVENQKKNISKLVETWQKSFDWDFGGMARAPKFMMPNNYDFFLNYATSTSNKNLLEFVNLTLTKMAYGGLFDVIHGGFSRYSVDLKWHVPHFEKMLYDNGQMVSLYAKAYQLTKNKLYKEVIDKTLKFVEQKWLQPNGNFFSALDADSLNNENHLEEGAFYTWTKEELKAILTDDFNLFSEVFNINEFGFWENDQYVLIQNKTLEEIAIKHNISIENLEQKKSNWENKLFLIREKRPQPRLDDKTIVSWNAIMNKGFSQAYMATQNIHYLNVAKKNIAFIQEKLFDSNGNLYRIYKNNKISIPAFLEDYAHLIDAYITIYKATFNEKWLEEAKQLTNFVIDEFYDVNEGFFNFKSRKTQELITPYYEVEDNVIPAANSVMANNLYNLSIILNNEYFERIANSMLQRILPIIDYPSGFSNWMQLELKIKANKQIVVIGKDALQWKKTIDNYFIPNTIVAGSVTESNLPILQHKYKSDETLLYVCENRTCKKPVNNLQDFLLEDNNY